MSEQPAVIRPTIFELLSSYRRSFEAMRAWLDESGLAAHERAGIADAWQAEMEAWFRDHGYCFVCHHPLGRCTCS